MFWYIKKKIAYHKTAVSVPAKAKNCSGMGKSKEKKTQTIKTIQA